MTVRWDTWTDDAGWLAVSPAGGTLTTGEAVSPALDVAVDMYYAGPPMDAGPYTATITITGTDPNSDPAANSPVSIPVTLTIFTF